VPEVSRFLGIVIRQYPGEHPPPHLHARYGGFQAQIAIESLEMMAEYLPTPQLRMVQGWGALRQTDLLANWDRLAAGESAQPTAPQH
jgi:hypothetical protein